MKSGETKQGKMKMKWTPEEDRILYNIIRWHGACHWDGIALHLKGRNGKQCRERWVTALSPYIRRDEWTAEEDKILLAMQHKLGNQWATIMKYLPGRSSIALKNRFKSLVRHGAKYNPMDPPVSICLENDLNLISRPTPAKDSSEKQEETLQNTPLLPLVPEDPIQIPTKNEFFFPIIKRIRLFI